MRHSSRLAWILAILSLVGAKAAAQEPFAWETNLERAQQVAAQTNRLVLVHFWAPWCGACKVMDAEVFSQANVAKQVQANYVPVKINADQCPELAKKFNLSGLPTDVVITPQGQIVNGAKGKCDAVQYVARLNQWAASARPQNAGMLASLPSGVPGTNINPPTNSIPANQPAMNAPGSMPPSAALPNSALPQPAIPAPAYGQSLSLNGPANAANPQTNGMPPQAAPAMRNPYAAPNAPPMNARANVPPSNMPANNVTQPPSGNPPLALDGYCPVTLVEKQQWVRGDKRWGAFHQGRTYLFTGPEEQRRFLANFDRYAPAISGDDIVLATEEHKAVPGLREHGVFFADHIFLFVNEATLQKFSTNPHYYANQALGSLRQAASNGQQPR